MFSPLKNKDYTRLLCAQLIALLGTGLTTVALALLAFQLADEDAGRVLGTALAIKMVAYVVLAPVAGGIAPLVPRRAYLIALDLARAGLVLCLPFVTQIWQIYVLIFLMQACSAGFTPVFQATIPDILENEEEYTKALSLSRLAYDVESLVSPALAGAALLVMGFSGLFVANGFAFLASALLVFCVRLPSAKPVSTEVTWRDRITFGARAYLATPRLRGLFAMSMAVSAAGSMVIVNTVVYVRSTLGLEDAWTAALLAAFGAGSMAAALCLPKVLAQVAEKPVAMGAGVLMAWALAAGLLMPGFVVVSLLWFCIGVGYSTVLVLAGRLLQRSASKEDRPAYFAAQFALSHACWLVTYPLAGWLGSAFGLQTAFLGLSVLVTLSVTAGYFVWPGNDLWELEHNHPAQDHAHLHVHDAHHQHDHEGWEGPEPHSHPHHHTAMRHRHDFVIDFHHARWPNLPG
ncbi:MAG: MFS transporter [Pseudomonadota bacterium]